MTVYVKGGVRYYELDDDTPVRLKHGNGQIIYLKSVAPHVEIQAFMDNRWCDVIVEAAPNTLEVRLSIKTYSSWQEAAGHIDEILRRAPCGIQEDPIISYRILRNNEGQ